MKEEFFDVLNIFFGSKMEGIHTMIPGKVKSYDAEKRLVSVLPLVGLKTSKNVDLEMPVINNVPFIFPSSPLFSLRWDVQSGDGCLILFAESAIGNYLNSQGTIQVAPEDASRFSLTDAICIPGLFPFSKVSELSQTNEIYIDSSGNMDIKGSSIKLNGSDKSFVTFSELDTALQVLVTAINAFFATKLDGGGSPGTSILDISSAKTSSVLTGG